MMDIYEFMDWAREQGLSAVEAENEWSKACYERREAWLEEYYERPDVQYGWHQQDMIDIRRRER